jgi:hypothetical protein
MNSTDPINETEIELLIQEGVAFYRAGDMVKAFAALSQALQRNSASELGWLWLSGVVSSQGERRYCLERVVALNPQHDVARRGLAKLEGGEAARSPLPIAPIAPAAPPNQAAELPTCQFPGCAARVAKLGHTVCRKHWQVPLPQTANDAKRLTSSTIGERCALPVQLVNQLLVELGWIAHERGGYVPTTIGNSLGAIGVRHQQGKPYVTWTEAIINNAVLQAAIRRTSGNDHEPKQIAESGFRDRNPANYRTNDGHMVRSRAEVMIDNWLYMAEVVHAYERRLPVEEEAYCDFYLPTGKVYLEYWGLEGDARYDARRQVKLAIYRKHQLNLIELTDEQLQNLDDHLPRLLRGHGVQVG